MLHVDVFCFVLNFAVLKKVSYVRRGVLYTQQLAVILSAKVLIAASCWRLQTCSNYVMLRLFLEWCFQIWHFLQLFSFGLTYTIEDDIFRRDSVIVWFDSTYCRTSLQYIFSKILAQSFADLNRVDISFNVIECLFFVYLHRINE